MSARDEYIYMARMAEQAERFEDMVEYMKRVACMGSELNHQERNLVSVAYKNCVASRRKAVQQVKKAEQEGRSPDVVAAINEYRMKIQVELQERCTDVINVLDQNLIPQATTGESKVFFWKMKGDYYRYLSEFAEPGTDYHASCTSNADTSYSSAMNVATSELENTNPIRLGLALNYSVFHFEVLRDENKACTLAREVMSSCEGLPPDAIPEDSRSILMLLKDNLELWMHSRSGDGRPADDGTGVEEL